MASGLDQIADRMRSALREGDLAHARELLLAYRREFDRVWDSMTDDERKCSPLPEQALRALEWARAMALMARQDLTANRQGVRAARQYAAPRAPALARLKA